MPLFWEDPVTKVRVEHAPHTLRYFVLFLVALALAFIAGYTCPREIVCDDDVVFHPFSEPYAVQAVCRGGFTVTLLE